ncbi:MAG: ABC transporter permease [Gordonibacter sp.]|uniref:ABC transporter permease n=1 Tax=Gordonibacter sp. TaxID=1968902 RepID=UPI002FCABD88
MWNVFKGTLAMLVRNRELFIWALGLPILLSTMFLFMFANLDDATAFEPVPTAVVEDGNYDKAAQFANTLNALAEPGDDQLLDVRAFATMSEAKKALENNEVAGILSIDAQGTPLLSVAAMSEGLGVEQINRTILNTITDTYLRNTDLLERIAEDNPMALSNPTAVEEALSRESATEQVSLTFSAPVQSVRYYYALLGMACLFCSQIGLIAICKTQPNLSALGARRAIGAVSRGKTLAATLSASWVIVFGCLVVAFSYMRFVVNVDFAGREGACIVALGVAALFTTAFGTFLGSLPKVTMHVKIGLITAATCLLSLFAGLYGEPCMELADDIARSFPVLATLNPAKVVADAFYSLYYYDSLAPYAGKLGILLVMTAALFAISSLFIRRQRYASL